MGASFHPNFPIIALIVCDACGETHAARFFDRAGFNALQCRSGEGLMIAKPKDRERVYKEIRADIGLAG